MGVRSVTCVCFVGEANRVWVITAERAVHRGSLGESSPRPPVPTAARHPREGAGGQRREDF